MGTKKQLSGADREFFNTVRQAIFVNPFSDQRAAIDRKIAGDQPGLDRSGQREVLAVQVGRRLAEVLGAARDSVRCYISEDRTLLEYGALFAVYHSYCDELDQLINQQITAGDQPCQVDFARDCLGAMTGQGIAAKEAERYFSLFFQMRRAFYFIDRIVGASPCMKGVRLALWNNLFTHDIGLYDRYLWNRMEDFSTMLLGETGTGKGMAAAAIGRAGFIPFDSHKGTFSESFTRAFVPINLSQFPEQLLESELFGHSKGAFTGAIDTHQGVFARCSPHGSIFLDEIGEVGAPVQIKLLKVLQERIFTPVGSHQANRFQGRVIAATNQRIDLLRRSGAFRDDFYYRLCSDIIPLPPLRQRLHEDAGELKRLLVVTVRRIVGKASSALVESTLTTLERSLPADYPWPGNVRELEQAVRRILLKQEYEGGGGCRAADPAQGLVDQLEQGGLTAQELMARYCAMLYERLGTYEAVARQVGLDRRTVRKYVGSLLEKGSQPQ